MKTISVPFILGLVANVLDFDIFVKDFELQSRDSVHFWTNTLEKGMNPITFSAVG